MERATIFSVAYFHSVLNRVGGPQSDTGDQTIATSTNPEFICILSKFLLSKYAAGRHIWHNYVKLSRVQDCTKKITGWEISPWNNFEILNYTYLGSSLLFIQLIPKPYTHRKDSQNSLKALHPVPEAVITTVGSRVTLLLFRENCWTELWYSCPSPHGRWKNTSDA